MMKIKDLKDIIKDLPDDLDVIIVNEIDSDNFPLVEVTSCGRVHAKFEDHDAFALLSSRATNVSDSVKSIGGYDSDLLYEDIPEGGYNLNQCINCGEYDKENHNCPAFCKVIRTTLKENNIAELEELKDKIWRISPVYFEGSAKSLSDIKLEAYDILNNRISELKKELDDGCTN